MAEHSLLAKRGFRTGILGSASSLAFAAPLANGDYDFGAHTDANRIGLYFDRTASAEKMGFVVMATEVLSVAAAGITVNGALNLPGSNTLTSSNLKRGAGAPNGSVTGSVGDIYQRTDGSTGSSLYIKESGSATNTGWVAVSNGGAASVAGNDTEVQFNDNGVFGGDPGLVFNKTTNALTLGGVLTVGGDTINLNGRAAHYQTAADTAVYAGSSSFLIATSNGAANLLSVFPGTPGTPGAAEVYVGNGILKTGSNAIIGGTLGVTGSTTMNGNLLLSRGPGGSTIEIQTTNSGSTRSVQFTDTAGLKYNWLVGAQNNVDQAFEITPSTAVGGSTFSTPALTIAGATLAATFGGALTAVGITSTAATNAFIANGGAYTLSRSSATDQGYNASVNGDAASRWRVSASGATDWGDGTAARDVGLHRNSAGKLEINSTVAGTFRDLLLRDLTASGAITAATITTSGFVTSGNGLASARVTINGAAATNRQLNFETAGLARWIFQTTSTAESTGNVGSDLALLARADDGNAIDTPISIVRAAGGAITMARPVAATGGASFSGSDLGIPTSGATNISAGIIRSRQSAVGGVDQPVFAFGTGATIPQFEMGILNTTSLSGAYLSAGQTFATTRRLDLRISTFTALRLQGDGASGATVTAFGPFTAPSMTISNLTAGRVAFTTTGGAITDSANLTYDVAQGRLLSTGRIGAEPATASDDAFVARVIGDGFQRYVVRADGMTLWGPGTAGRDVAIERDSAGVLQINNTATNNYRDLKLRHLIASGDVTIAGNLTVDGTTVTLNTTTLDVEDRVIHVNHSTGTVPVPSAIAGLSVHRGNTGAADRDHAGLFWDEANSRFNFAWNTLGDDATLGTDLPVKMGALTTSAITLNGDLTTTGSIIGSIRLPESSSLQFGQSGTGRFLQYFNDYVVTTAAPVSLVDSVGAAFSFGKSYRVRGFVQNTSTDTGAEAIFWSNNGTSWVVRNVYERGVTSNHVRFYLDAGVPKVSLWNHAGTYTVSVFTEEVVTANTDNGATPWFSTNLSDTSDQLSYFGSTVSFGSDTDGTNVIGRAKVGSFVGTDSAAFSHFDHAGAATYAFLQNASGDTYVNAVTGRTIFQRINDATVGTITASKITSAVGFWPTGGTWTANPGDGTANFYSSTNSGAILVGQGTTNDFNLLNRNGSSVLRNPTGTTDLMMNGGTLTTGAILHVSGDQPRIRLDETDTTDTNWELLNSGGTFFVRSNNDAFNSSTNRLSIDQSGNASFTGSLAVSQDLNFSGRMRTYSRDSVQSNYWKLTWSANSDYFHGKILVLGRRTATTAMASIFADAEFDIVFQKASDGLSDFLRITKYSKYDDTTRQVRLYYDPTTRAFTVTLYNPNTSNISHSKIVLLGQFSDPVESYENVVPVGTEVAYNDTTYMVNDGVYNGAHYWPVPLNSGAHKIDMTDNASTAMSIVQGTNDYLRFATTNSLEQVVIGNTTTNPQTVVQASSTARNVLQVSNAAASYTEPIVEINAGTGAAVTDIAFRLRTNSTNRITMTGNGNINMLSGDILGQRNSTNLVLSAGTATNSAANIELGGTTVNQGNLRINGSNMLSWTATGVTVGTALTGTSSASFTGAISAQAGAWTVGYGTINAAAGGWVKVLSSNTAGSGRGKYRLILSTTGGSHTPNTMEIEFWKGWSTASSDAQLLVKNLGNQNFWFTQARLTQEASGACWLEINAAAAVQFTAMLLAEPVIASTWSLSDGTAASGTATVVATSQGTIGSTHSMHLPRGIDVGGVLAVGGTSTYADTLTSTKADTVNATVFQNTVASTGGKQLYLANTGGNLHVGVEASTNGAYYTGSEAYDATVYTNSKLYLYGEDSIKLKTSTAGGTSITLGSTSTNWLTADTNGVLIANTGVLYFGQNGTIRSNTADGSDNGSVTVNGGGGAGTTRGGSIAAFGNEHANVGAVVATLGNTGNSYFNILASATQVFQVGYGGNTTIGNPTSGVVASSAFLLSLYNTPQGALTRYVINTGANYNWVTGCQFNVNDGYEITPSTAAGGSTFSSFAVRVNGANRSTEFNSTAELMTTFVSSNASPTVVIRGAATGNTANYSMVRFDQKDSAGNDTVFGYIATNSTTITDTAEIGRMDLATISAGTLAARIRIQGPRILIGSNPSDDGTNLLQVYGTIFGSSTLSVSGNATAANLKRGTGTPEGAVTGSVGDVYQRTDGSTGTTLYVKESGNATNTGWIAHGAGGGGTPAGANTSVQYNNSGVFGGSANFAWDNAANLLSLSHNAAASTNLKFINTIAAATTNAVGMQFQLNGSVANTIFGAISAVSSVITGTNHGTIKISPGRAGTPVDVLQVMASSSGTGYLLVGSGVTDASDGTIQVSGNVRTTNMFKVSNANGIAFNVFNSGSLERCRLTADASNASLLLYSSLNVEIGMFASGNTAILRLGDFTTTSRSQLILMDGVAATNYVVLGSAATPTAKTYELRTGNAAATDATLNLVNTGAAYFHLGLSGQLTTGGLKTKIRTITGGTSCAADDHTILVDCTSGNINVTLPAESGNNGRMIVVKKIDSTANTVNVAKQLATHIDGQTNQQITAQWDSLTFQCDGTNWYII